MDTGKLLKKYRLNQGLTQKELAEKIGCTPAFISQIENENNKIPLSKLQTIYSVLRLNKNEKAEISKSIVNEFTQKVLKVAGL